MQIKFYRLNNTEIKYLIDNCNFTEDEQEILMLAAKRKSDVFMANALSVSLSTVTRTKKRIYGKILDYVGRIDEMATIMVNGKPLSDEEIKDYKIVLKNVGETIEAKLTKKEK
jgi:hypothetical protein